jgi:hypothetical protein
MQANSAPQAAQHRPDNSKGRSMAVLVGWFGAPCGGANWESIRFGGFRGAIWFKKKPG